MTAGVVTVHQVFPALISQQAAVACLTGDERLRVARFRFRKDALHWTACRAYLRKILGQAIQLPPDEVPIIPSEFGKPTLAPPFDSIHFNLSHSLDLALVAIGVDGPVGIDLENLDRAKDLLECAPTFCHFEELRNLSNDTSQRARQLLRIWTAKEAILKAIGCGLSHPPESLRIVFSGATGRAFPDLPVAGIEAQRLRELASPEFKGYQVFISVPESVRSIKIFSGI